MDKPQLIASVFAVVFIISLGALGCWYINQQNERLLLLQERSVGAEWNRPQEQLPEIELEPEPTTTQKYKPPKTSDFAEVAPDEHLTRAMFTALLAQLDGADLAVYTTIYFEDVQNDKWYSSAVGWAADMSVVNGVGGSMFAPDDSISREQIAVMLCNYMEYKGRIAVIGEIQDISDFAKINQWALESVNAMRSLGILSDRPDKTFDPQGKVTNAEADEIFERLFYEGE